MINIIALIIKPNALETNHKGLNKLLPIEEKLLFVNIGKGIGINDFLVPLLGKVNPLLVLLPVDGEVLKVPDLNPPEEDFGVLLNEPDLNPPDDDFGVRAITEAYTLLLLWLLTTAEISGAIIPENNKTNDKTRLKMNCFFLILLTPKLNYM